jgi:broad specificity phosphatase PhoE
MAIFYLIRHGTNDLVASHTLAGRQPGIHLNEAGRAEAAHLAARLAHAQINHIFSSPLERAIETAEPLAERLKLPIQVAEGFLELNSGEWTNRKFADLESAPDWKIWNQYRTGGITAGGELFLQVQARMVGEIETLRRKYPNDRIAIFSHGDPLRAVLLYYLGMSLDLFHRLEISPCSYSKIELTDFGARLHCLNVTDHAEE